jgi:aryl-alcohol dehydrogenase-like predicted oxidoreductase
MGNIIKRPIGNAQWGTKSRSTDSSSMAPGEYFRRAQEMARMGPIPGAPNDPTLLALGFVYAHPETDTALVGTGNPSHLRSNIEPMERGVALSTETVEELHRRFDKLGDPWIGRN